MEKIYIVSSGSYSDYHIDGVFSTRTLAERFISSFNTQNSYDTMGIEEWDLDLEKDKLELGYKLYFLRVSKDKKINEIRQDTSSYGYRDSTLSKDIKGNHIIHLFAKDEEHAKKIALDKIFHLNN